ncbi:MAG: outer membrane lipoprotein chaperone LolA [Gammaproteobacteria bacterium]
MLNKNVLALAAFFLSGTAAAAPPQTPTQRLDALLATTRTFTAHFTETVTNANAATVKNASGMVAIAKPGRFRWDYERPYKQVIVADGEKLWIYDPELEQVTVRTESQALTAGPASLLAGSGNVAASFTVSDASGAAGLDWLQLTPKSADSDYRAIRIGLAPDGQIRALELDSNLGETSRIDFSNVKSNTPVDAALFRFKPPPDADVVQEAPSAASAGGP